MAREFTFEDLQANAEQEQKTLKEAEPSFVNTLSASARTTITGANTFLNMVERKHIMPNNEGDDNFYKTSEFNDIIKQELPKASLSDVEELSSAKNPIYLRNKIQNMNNYNNAVDTIEKSGITGMGTTLVTSLVDPTSWFAGGLLFKAGKTAKVALDIQKTGASLLYDMGHSAVVGGGSLALSESAIQSEAGVNLDERVAHATEMGAAFGLALPLLGHAFTSVASGEGRASLAQGTTSLLDNVPGSGSLRGLFSLSSADQAINKSFSETLKDIGNKAVTRVSAAKDANGNFITHMDDTAMDYKSMLLDSSLSDLHYGAYENSKVTGKDLVQQSFDDGVEWNRFSNSTEQTARREVAQMSQDELVAAYKEATGIQELPHEKKQLKVDANYQKMVDTAEATFQRDLGVIQTQKTREFQDLVNKEVDKLRIQKEKLGEDTTQPITLGQDILDKLQARVDKNYKAVENTVNKQKTKSIKEADKFKEKNQLKKEDMPDDMYDVVFYHRKKQGFEDGRFIVPKNLEYIQKFYSKYGDEATKYGLKGIAGKDSRGYGHIKYNTDHILANPDLAKTQFKEMLLDDELNKALLARGEITMEDVDKLTNNFIDAVSHRDFQSIYTDGLRGVQSTSATKQRVLRLNRALHPDMFVNDIHTIGTEYADRLTGKLALKKIYGLDNDNFGSLQSTLTGVYDKIASEARANGANASQIKRDVDNAKAIFESILGSRNYVRNPDEPLQKAARLLRKTSSALYNAGFVKYAIVEPTVAIFRYGLKPVLNNYVPAIKNLKAQIENASPNDPMLNLFKQAGLAVQTQRAMKYSRYENFEITPTTGKTEMWLDKVSHWGRKYSGFNFVNDTNDWVAGGSALHELQTVMERPTNLSRAEASRMARYGLSTQDLEAIAKQKIDRDSSGDVSNWNFENWKDQELAHRFVRYLNRATTDTILRADGTRVHRWQSDVNSPLFSAALQFTQMPVALHERLLLNLGDEVSTRTFVGTLSAIGSMYGMLELEDAAMYASGATDKRATHDQLLLKAVTRTPMAGIAPNFIDFGLMLTKHAPLGSEYKPNQDLASLFGGAGYSTGNKILKTFMGLSDGVNSTDAANILKLAPIINSLPIFNVGMKSLENDLREQGKLEGAGELQMSKPMYQMME